MDITIPLADILYRRHEHIRGCFELGLRELGINESLPDEPFQGSLEEDFAVQGAANRAFREMCIPVQASDSCIQQDELYITLEKVSENIPA